MPLLKRCIVCHEYFESIPLAYEFFCASFQCQKKKNHVLHEIKKTRFIPPAYFDLYVKENDLYFHACRVCGIPLRKKDKSPNHKSRNCQDHESPYLAWNHVAAEYLNNYYKKNICKTTEKIKTIGIPLELHELFEVSFVLCEECGDFVHLGNYLSDNTLYRKYYNESSAYAIHHKSPIYKIQRFEELPLMFSHDNLILLCEPCHKKKHKTMKEPITLKEANIFQSLDSFLVGRNF
jgi:5-methylcytosine-specific restriction endonuclease McrA